MLDMRQLAALTALERAGSIAGAARDLKWSQPTVTHHLRGLTATLGAPVVVSEPSGTRLTAAGLSLLPTAQTILALARRAEREVSIARGSEGGLNPLANALDPLRVGVIPSVGASVMPLLLRDLMQMDARVAVTEGETDRLVVALASMELDVAILLGGESVRSMLPPGTVYRPLSRERLVLLLPAQHPLAGSSDVSLRDLRDEQWVLSPSNIDPLDELLRIEARQADVEIRGSVFSDDYAVIQNYVAAGLGLTLVPESLVPRDRRDVATARLTGDSFVREIGVAIAPHAPRQLVEPFMDRLLYVQEGITT
ncbi:MAG: LysR family transcriptional regulator [Microbacteriaceae bacterium]